MKLYKAYELEFSKTIRSISMMGYGCVFACHTETKEIATGHGDEVIERLQPKLDRRAFDVINGLVDIIGIGVMRFNEKGEQCRKLITTETPTVCGGNRFSGFPPVIDFSYPEVLRCLSEAIEREGSAHPDAIVDKIEKPTEEKLDYIKLRAEAQDLWTKLVGVGENASEDMAKRIMTRVEIIFGRPMKISEITETQVDLLQLVVMDMKELQASL